MGMRLYRSQVPRLAEDIINTLAIEGDIIVLAEDKDDAALHAALAAGPRFLLPAASPAHPAASPAAPRGGVALVVGSEVTGVDPAVMALCDGVVEVRGACFSLSRCRG